MKKIIAIYLPQFHEFEENNKWWGKGFTEWENCKSSKSLFLGHNQPRVPLNENYYDLSKIKVQKEQVELAKKYGIYGFCYYHYWFCGKKLMELPLENMLTHKSIDFPFCISWANHNWQNKVQLNNRIMLMKQEYGNQEDWTNHFNYFRDFFIDKRYIKIDNKPLLVIYDAKRIDNFEEMIDFWNQKAKEIGFNGIYIVNTLKDQEDIKFSKKRLFCAQMEYQPTFAVNTNKRFFDFPMFYNYRRLINKDLLKRPFRLDYSKVWKKIHRSTPDNDMLTMLGSYVGWDTTPRWKERGIVHINDGPEIFKKYFKIQYDRKSKNISEYMFITAWNEWGEGAYLEPDEKYRFKYLEVIRQVCNNENDKF